MKKLLLLLDTDGKPSSFDQIAAYDAGVDHILAYGGVSAAEVQNLVYGAMFTRGGGDLKNTAIFIGGSSVPPGEEVLKKTLGTFFGPVRVSVMFDANGCNTTAAAAVTRIAQTGDLAGKKAAVLAGTGPVGMRAALLLVREGCEVRLTSRELSRAQAATGMLKAQYGVEVHPAQVGSPADVVRVLEGVHLVLSCGGPGVRLLPQEVWQGLPDLRILADVNAVEPLGIQGIKVTDDGKEREGRRCFGAIGIGNLKMKVHREAVRRLFESNDLVLDVEEVHAIAKSLADPEKCGDLRAGQR